jgi:hypothetical protein
MSVFRSERGSATVEHAGLILALAGLFAILIVAMRSTPPSEQTHDLARAIAQKMRCAPRLPGPCWRDPLTEAYGRSLAGAVRALAPNPVAEPGPGGDPELPVDFRRCRSASCATPGPRPGLTASNRRVTDFVSVERRRESGGGSAITYWHYRPGLPWRRTVVPADGDLIASLAMTPLLESDVPSLVPLETLDGRNQVRFAAVEEPPWRWRVRSVYPG